MGEVGGDVAGGDVRVFADLGVTDVREVRDLRAGADLGVLDLDEGAGLRAGGELRAWAQVGEGAYERAGPDFCIDGDDMWADLCAGGDARLPAQDREGVNRRVRLELDIRLDPGGLGVDDGHAREHVVFVHARA